MCVRGIRNGCDEGLTDWQSCRGRGRGKGKAFLFSSLFSHLSSNVRCYMLLLFCHSPWACWVVCLFLWGENGAVNRERIAQDLEWRTDLDMVKANNSFFFFFFVTSPRIYWRVGVCESKKLVKRDWQSGAVVEVEVKAIVYSFFSHHSSHVGYYMCFFLVTFS